MNCTEAKERIDDCVDGLLPPDERVILLAHFAECAACRREEIALRELLRGARNLKREVTPGEGVWEGIAARVSHRDRKAETRHAFRRRSWIAASVLAAALLLIVTVIMIDRLPPQTFPKDGTIQADSTQSPVDTLAECTRERDALMDDFSRQKEMLPPDIVAAVQGDLLVIESAVSEIELALNTDPGNERLQQMLTMTCEKQVGLLAQVVELANRA